jgi:hypothetical protein
MIRKRQREGYGEWVEEAARRGKSGSYVIDTLRLTAISGGVKVTPSNDSVAAYGSVNTRAVTSGTPGPVTCNEFCHCQGRSLDDVGLRREEIG